MLQRAERHVHHIQFQPPEKDEPTLEVSGARSAHSHCPAAIVQQNVFTFEGFHIYHFCFFA